MSAVKTVLITGAARRIGRAIAQKLAADGWAIGVHYNDSDTDARDLVESIQADGGRAESIKADLLDEIQVLELLAKTKESLGVVGCLINNAAVFEKDTIHTVSRETWDRHMHVNLMAPLLLTQSFARELPDDTDGNIINVLDQRVWNLSPGFLSYTLSKSALWTLTQTAAMALAPRIRVNAIGPGPTMPSTHQSDAQFQKQCDSLPLKHGATPEEIAEAVKFILDAPAITGQMIAVDGGQHLGWTTGAAPDQFD